MISCHISVIKIHSHTQLTSARRSNSTPDLSALILQLDPNSFILTNPKFTIPHAQLSRQAKSRNHYINNFVAGNFNFIYKNISQIDKSKYQDLNDILFSHTFFSDTYPLWDLLFCVTVHQSDDFVCPICLFKPVAPRMTRCGHVFCADCLRLLFEKSDKHACPVCYEPILRSDIVRVNLVYHPPLSSTCRFKKLLKYSKLNVCCFSASNQDFPGISKIPRSPNSADIKPSNIQLFSKAIVKPNSNEIRLFHTLPKASNENSLFTQFSIADDDFIFKMMNEEVFDIDHQITEMLQYNDTEKIQALQAVRQSIAEEKQIEDETEFQLVRPGSTFSDTIESFYQIEDGRLIFLDSMNVRMIEDNFQDNDLPDIIEGQIISQKHITIDQVYKQLEIAFNHLHIGSEITTVLLDIDHLLKPEIVEKYKVRMNNKKKAEQHKNREQRRAKSKNSNQRIITSADYQKFVPIEEPVIRLTNEDFPSLSSLNQEPQMSKMPAQPIKMKEDYPSLNGNVPPPMQGTKKNWGGMPPPPQSSQTGPIFQQQFPSLETSKPQQKKKKVASAWGSLKL